MTTKEAISFLREQQKGIDTFVDSLNLDTTVSNEFKIEKIRELKGRRKGFESVINHLLTLDAIT